MIEEPSRLAGTFDSSMRNIQAITGNTESEMKALSARILEIGGSAVSGPQGAADAFNDIAGGVENAAAHLPMLQSAVTLAEAGQADLGVAANGLVSIMNAYRYTTSNAATETEQLAEISQRASFTSDVLTQAVGAGVGSMEEFVGAMSQVSGLSSSVGVGLDEVGSALAWITTQGPSASEAATQIRAAETALLNPNDALSKALESVGIKSGSAMLKQYGLAASLDIVKQAVGGSQDAMAKALGSVHALNGATYLLGDGYENFAANFGGALANNVTAEAAAVQNQSYESKLARMSAASNALKIQMGDDINAIKGFFVDMGTGFLNNVAGPIMSSPVGGVFQRIAAFTGIAAQGILQMGSGALNTATQLVTLTATLDNAGGFAKLFGSAASMLTAPIKGIGAAALKIIPKVAAMGASLWAALAPVLPFIAAGAALAGIGILIAKNFDKIRGVLAGVSDKVLGVVAVFMPIIGIPALIIKHWDTIKAFFVGLWVQVSETFTAAWTAIVNWFTNLWNAIPGFFASVWSGITGVAASVATWFGSVWSSVAGAFAGVWIWVKNLFTSIWDAIKGVVMGFVEWLSPVIDAIIAPFRAIGEVIGKIIGTVKGWFGDTVDRGATRLAEISEAKAARAAAAEDLAKPAGMPPVAAPSLGAAAMPAFNVPEIAGAGVSGAAGVSAGDGGLGRLAEHMAAASRKGIAASDVSTSASDAFMGAGTAALDFDAMAETAQVSFAEAMPHPAASAAALPWNQTGEREQPRAASKTVNVQNVYLQADDCKSVFDLMRLFEQIAYEPAEASV
jgi:TP901 family phage tail tape measure protein